MFKAYIQYILPQRLLTAFVARFADSKSTWLKNLLIRQFIRLYKVDTSIAESEDLNTYPDFTSFFYP